MLVLKMMLHEKCLSPSVVGDTSAGLGPELSACCSYDIRYCIFRVKV